MGVCSGTNFMSSRNCLWPLITFSSWFKQEALVSLELVISLRSPGVLLLIRRSVECHSNTRGGGGRMGVSDGEHRGKLSLKHWSLSSISNLRVTTFSPPFGDARGQSWTLYRPKSSVLTGLYWDLITISWIVRNLCFIYCKSFLIMHGPNVSSNKKTYKGPCNCGNESS